MTPPKGAGEILKERPQLDFAVDILADRAGSHKKMSPNDAKKLRDRVRDRSLNLLDEWSKIARDLSQAGVALQYQKEAGAAQRLLYEFLNPELKTLPPRHRKFRANRSMRDVEPSVNLWLKTIDGIDIKEDEK
jgi:hypothetical protein